jgi:hypothetical protein
VAGDAACGGEVEEHGRLIGRKVEGPGWQIRSQLWVSRPRPWTQIGRAPTRRSGFPCPARISRLCYAGMS